jgi:hypothetical protein
MWIAKDATWATRKIVGVGREVLLVVLVKGRTAAARLSRKSLRVIVLHRNSHNKMDVV